MTTYRGQTQGNTVTLAPEFCWRVEICTAFASFALANRMCKNIQLEAARDGKLTRPAFQLGFYLAMWMWKTRHAIGCPGPENVRKNQSFNFSVQEGPGRERFLKVQHGFLLSPW